MNTPTMISRLMANNLFHGAGLCDAHTANLHATHASDDILLDIALIHFTIEGK